MGIIKNTVDLEAQADATLPDNTTQLISPQDEREMAKNLAVSNYNKITDSALVGLKEYSVIPTYESGQGCINAGKVYISNKITGPGVFAAADWDLYSDLSTADKAKLDFITVTSGADLDQMQTDIAALDGARINKGTFDQALGVFPGGGTAQDGWTWIAVGVTTIIDGVEINPDDAIVSILDNASTTTFAGNWHLQDNTDKVLSVNSQSGNVVLDKTDIGLSNVPNTDFTTAVGLNTAKLTNATHSGEVSGAGALTVEPAAVSNKALITATGAMELLVNDAGTLKKVVASDFLTSSNLYTSNGTIGAGRVATLTDTLTFTGGSIGVGVAGSSAYKMQIKGDSTGTTATWSLWVRDSANNSSFIVKDNLDVHVASKLGVGINTSPALGSEVLHVGGDTLIEGDVNIGALTANPNARLTVEVPAATGVGTVWKDTTGDIVTIGRNGAGAGQIDVVGLLGDIKFGGTVSSYVNNKLPFAVNGISGGAAFNVYSDAGAAIQYLYDRNDDLSFTFLAETNNNKFDIYNYGGGSIQHQFRSNGNDSYVNGTTAANFGVGTSTPTARFNTLGSVKMESLPVHADEAAAIVAGLTTDSIYKTATGELRIKL